MLKNKPSEGKYQTFLKHYNEHFVDFINVLVNEQPDYIVPVEKKGCKLLKSSQTICALTENDKVKYIQYFERRDIELEGKKIIVVDDAVKYTSNLYLYREFFEKRGATVVSYAFIGHKLLDEGIRKKYDNAANIYLFLEESEYQEYILEQSLWISNVLHRFDIDHLRFKVEMSEEVFTRFFKRIAQIGKIVIPTEIDKQSDDITFSLVDIPFFNSVPYLAINNLDIGEIIKIRFKYSKRKRSLFLAPLIFPNWEFKEGDLLDFSEVPFIVPYCCHSNRTMVDRKYRLADIYDNIILVYIVSLLKAFSQKFNQEFEEQFKFKIEDQDITSYIDVENAERVILSIENFLDNDEEYSYIRYEDTNTTTVEQLLEDHKYEFVNFGQIVDFLRSEYLRKVNEKHSHLNVSFFMSYDAVFSSYKDRYSIHYWLDNLCDKGILSTRNRSEKNKFFRAVRSGEPYGIELKRTSALIPLAIQLCGEKATSEIHGDHYRIKPMKLHKILANFIYDFDNDQHPLLHNLMVQPKDFGSLVYAKRTMYLNEPIAIYENEEISPFYEWIKNGEDKEVNGHFITTTSHLDKLEQRIEECFSEKDNIPMSTIVSYFLFLNEVFNHFQNVDVLNALSICRSKSYYINHIRYNIVSWNKSINKVINSFTDKVTTSFSDKDTIRLIRSGAKHADSARTKVGLAKKFTETFIELSEVFKRELATKHVLRLIEKNREEFDTQFGNLVKATENIVLMQSALTEYLLFIVFEKKKYFNKYQQYLNELENATVFVELEKHRELEDKEGQKIVRKIFSQIIKEFSMLPEIEMKKDLVAIEARQYIYNEAARIIAEEQATSFYILHADLSDYRINTDTINTTVTKFYTIFERNLIGGFGHSISRRDGNDCYSILFFDFEIIKDFCHKVYDAFKNDDELSSVGLKIGIAHQIIETRESKHNAEFGVDTEVRDYVVKCWGQASDLCNLEDNYGYTVLSENSISGMELSGVSSNNFERFNSNSYVNKYGDLYILRETNNTLS